KLSISKVNFDELNINEISKRSIFDSLSVFWNSSEMTYLEYLDNIGIDYYKKSPNIFKLNENLNEEIKKFQEAIASENIGDFDFKAIKLFGSKNLKEINDNEYFRLNIDLRDVYNEESLQGIKDAFILTRSPSLVEFKTINENRLSLIFHKKGAMKYFDNYLINNTRTNSIQLLENFKEPKDNNFIVARFLLELSRALKEKNINEDFSYSYYIGNANKETIENIDNIILWGEKTPQEKEEAKAEIKNQENIENSAKEIAKKEIKEENNKTRDSLEKDSTEKVLDTEKAMPKLQTISSLEEEIENKEVKKEDTEKEITKVIENSFEIYRQKELEKTKIRLEKAEKDSLQAYDDLKKYLNNGTSILEAIKNIQQQYRNEDTINFATLLFSKDILSLKSKEQEIQNLKEEFEKSKKYENELIDEISKREETISKIKGTLQTKINEMALMKEEFDEEIKHLRENDLKLQELTRYSNEQEEVINEMTKANELLSAKVNGLKNNLFESNAEKNLLKDTIAKLEEKEKEKENIIKQNYDLQFENKYFQKIIGENKENEKKYQEKIEYLEKKLELIFDRFVNNNSVNLNETNDEKQLRVKDILGDIR
ncbi:coiled-coil domain-containing protein, partial [Campylobacter coli]